MYYYILFRILRIRKLYDSETTVIILTAYNRDEIMDEALHIGVDSFLSKPVESDRLFRTLEELIWEKDMKKKDNE